jgi:hypothetical protein
MTNEEFNYLITLTINERITFSNEEEVLNNLVGYIGNVLLNKMDNINIEYAINEKIIYIFITTEQEVKIKTSSIKEFIYKNNNTIEEDNKQPNLIKCTTKQLKHMKTLHEYLQQQNKTKYEKQKDAIYKWREANKEAYLLKQHQYFKNKMENPEHKRANLERIKEINKKLKEEEQQRTGIIRKVGRPSKY